MQTIELFRSNPYARFCDAHVVSIDKIGIELDSTVFYSMGGGQPGDQGELRLTNGEVLEIIDCYKESSRSRHLHITNGDLALLTIGDKVTAVLNWDRRYRLMRMHSCLHLVTALIRGSVTGAQVGEFRSRIDFDTPDPIDKDRLEHDLNQLIKEDHVITDSRITEKELSDKPDLIRTMSVQPPIGVDNIRLIAISGVDLQPCGGTHVSSTSEIGTISIGKIVNKGKHNRRVNVNLED